MKIAYIILAYKDPEQVFGMMRSLQNISASFFLHVDANSKIDGFKNFPDNLDQTRIHLSENRFKTNWSSFGCVEAILFNMKKIVSLGDKFDFVITLTGQDYPLQKLIDIEKRLLQNPNNIYMEFFKLPSPKWKNGGISRVMSYHFNLFKNRTVIKIFHRMMIFLSPILPTKKMGAKYDLYGGEAHFIFPFETVGYMLDFINKNPKFLSFFKHTYMPDEVIFQTLLMNSPFKDKVVNNTLKYTDWSKPEHGLPAILTTSDFKSLEKSDCLFARKFDAVKSQKLLDLIDTNLLS